MCPNCKVMIVKTEGCKFMECAKCNFQFCWLCLSEFYTEYHYYQSMCPMRVVPIYGMLLLCSLLLVLKVSFVYELAQYWDSCVTRVLVIIASVAFYTL